MAQLVRLLGGEEDEEEREEGDEEVEAIKVEFTNCICRVEQKHECYAGSKIHSPHE